MDTNVHDESTEYTEETDASPQEPTFSQGFIDKTRR